MKKNKSQIIHSENMSELTRLKDEYEFIGRKTTIDESKMTLTIHNLDFRKKKKRITRYEKIDNKYS